MNDDWPWAITTTTGPGFAHAPLISNFGASYTITAATPCYTVLPPASATTVTTVLPSASATTVTPGMTHTGVTNSLLFVYTRTSALEALEHLQTVGEDVVPIPMHVVRTAEDGTWETWVNEVAVERDRRQAAREAYAQAEHDRMETARQAQATRAAASARAKGLLFSFLTAEQRASWEAHQFFITEVAGHRYRFTHGIAGNVYRLGPTSDEAVERFCIHPVAPHDGGILPTEDVVLAQLLQLQADEERFRLIANVTML